MIPAPRLPFWTVLVRGIALALSAFTVLAGMMVVPRVFAAVAHRVADSTGTAKTINISDRGIRIDGALDSNSTERNSHRRHRTRLRTHNGLITVDDNGNGEVRLFSDIEIAPGEHVDGDVVAVFGSVRVAGEIEGDVVAVFGSVKLEPGARVSGDAVSVGGTLQQADGSTVNGNSVSLGLFPITWGLPALPVLMISVAGGWFVSLFVGWIFSLLFPNRMLRVAHVSAQRPVASFFVGVLSLPLALIAMMLLCVTLIGIPIAILLPPAYAILGYGGQLAATAVLGAKLMRRPLSGRMMGPLFAGTLFVAVFFVAAALFAVGEGVARQFALFFALFGVLLVVGLASIGTGALLLSRIGSRPKELVWTPESQHPAPGAVMGSAVPPSPV